MKIITQQQIKALGISPEMCVQWIRESFAMKKQAQLPAKISVHPADTDFFTSMPCLLPHPAHTAVNFKRQYFGIKEVHRIEGAVPSLGSDMMLYDAATGELLALLDTDWITTMRTGAVAAVSAQALRKPNATTYGFVGLGNTARATLLCVLHAEPEKHFNVKLLKYKDQAEQFVARFAGYENVSFEVMEHINEMASTVDVLVSCITSATGQLVSDQALLPGITVIPVHMRGFQNCDTTFDRVLGDDTDHVRGFKYFSQFRGYNEIGEVLAGADPGRTSNEQRIIDYNYGLALHDVTFAAKIYELLEHDPNVQCVAMVKETEKFWV